MKSALDLPYFGLICLTFVWRASRLNAEVNISAERMSLYRLP